MPETETIDKPTRLAYATEPLPWSPDRLGVSGLETSVSSDDALTRAGLNWDVKLGALYGPRPPKGQPWNKIEDKLAIYRADTYEVLGFGTHQYHPYGNIECFDWLTNLMADGLVVVENAFTLGGGKQVVLIGRLTEDMQVNGEEHLPYMVLTTRHDGGGALQIVPTEVRVICMNTLRLALRMGAARGTLLRMVHRPNLKAKMQAAATALEITTESMRRFKTFAELAQGYALATDEVEAISTDLVGGLDEATTDLQRERITTFKAIYDAEVALNGATAYTLVNAATGYADHVGRGYTGDLLKQAETRLLYTQAPTYPGTELKYKAIDAVASLSPDLRKAAAAMATVASSTNEE